MKLIWAWLRAFIFFVLGGNSLLFAETIAVNGGDALGTLSIMMMMLLTLMLGLYFIRKEA